MKPNPPITNWAGRRVWLIGASSGIGAALAEDLLARGARVALSARRQPELEQLAHGSGHALVLPFDAADEDAWASAWSILRADWGAVDLVLFCAADYRPYRSWDIRADQVRHTLNVNLGSVYFGLEHILPDMLARGSGGVGIIASLAGYMGLPNATLYGPTKAALINLAELLYYDLAPRGLSVYLINPGFVRTRLTADNDFTMPALQTPRQAADAIVRGMMRGRFEIAFPRRFTGLLKLVRQLPYRLRFALLHRALGL